MPYKAGVAAVAAAGKGEDRAQRPRSHPGDDRDRAVERKVPKGRPGSDVRHNLEVGSSDPAAGGSPLPAPIGRNARADPARRITCFPSDERKGPAVSAEPDRGFVRLSGHLERADLTIRDAVGAFVESDRPPSGALDPVRDPERVPAMPAHPPQPVAGRENPLRPAPRAAVCGKGHPGLPLARAVWHRSSSHQEHEALPRRDGELRVAQVHSILGKERRSPPPRAVRGFQDAHLSSGCRVGACLAKDAEPLPAKACKVREGAVRAPVPDLAEGHDPRRCHDRILSSSAPPLQRMRRQAL